MASHSERRQNCGFFGENPVVVEPVECQLSSDAGMLPVRPVDETIGFTQHLDEALGDPRDPRITRHHMAEMTRSPISGIPANDFRPTTSGQRFPADDEDQNDHRALRSDPVSGMIAGRSPDAQNLASQPTFSRFENSIRVGSLWRAADEWLSFFEQRRFAARNASPSRESTTARIVTQVSARCAAR